MCCGEYCIGVGFAYIVGKGIFVPILPNARRERVMDKKEIHELFMRVLKVRRELQPLVVELEKIELELINQTFKYWFTTSSEIP